MTAPSRPGIAGLALSSEGRGDTTGRARELFGRCRLGEDLDPSAVTRVIELLSGMGK